MRTAASTNGGEFLCQSHGNPLSPLTFLLHEYISFTAHRAPCTLTLLPYYMPEYINRVDCEAPCTAASVTVCYA